MEGYTKTTSGPDSTSETLFYLMYPMPLALLDVRRDYERAGTTLCRSEMQSLYSPLSAVCLTLPDLMIRGSLCIAATPFIVITTQGR